VTAKRAAEPPQPPREGWLIQIAATPDENKALELLSRAKEATKMLRSAESFTEPVAKDDVTLYRARFAGLDKRTAQLACDALKRADMSCFAIKN
jgi:D-alanyl-D-alanine carboxypeptidase